MYHIIITILCVYTMYVIESQVLDIEEALQQSSIFTFSLNTEIDGDVKKA